MSSCLLLTCQCSSARWNEFNHLNVKKINLKSVAFKYWQIQRLPKSKLGRKIFYILQSKSSKTLNTSLHDFLHVQYLGRCLQVLPQWVICLHFTLLLSSRETPEQWNLPWQLADAAGWSRCARWWRCPLQRCCVRRLSQGPRCDLETVTKQTDTVSRRLKEREEIRLVAWSQTLIGFHIGSVVAPRFN